MKTEIGSGSCDVAFARVAMQHRMAMLSVAASIYATFRSNEPVSCGTERTWRGIAYPKMSQRSHKKRVQRHIGLGQFVSNE
jgi:hypothetical protein